jgi:hypothetical protein
VQSLDPVHPVQIGCTASSKCTATAPRNDHKCQCMLSLRLASPIVSRTFLLYLMSRSSRSFRFFCFCSLFNISLLRPILAVLPLRGRIRADFGLVRVSGKNPNQRPSRSPDTNPEYPRAALGCLEKNPTQSLFYIFNS